ALAALPVRHESLGARLVQHEGQPWLECGGPAGSLPVRSIDCSRPPDDQTLAAVVAELGAQLDPAAGLLASAAVIKAADSITYTVLVLHDLAADDVSWGIVAEDLATGYSQPGAAAGALPTTLATIQQALSAPIASAKAVAITDRGQAEMFPAALPEPIACQHFSSALDARHSALALRELPTGYHLQTAELLAILIAWAWPGQAPEIEVEGRQIQRLPELADSRVVGCLSTRTPVRLAITPGPLSLLLPGLKEQLRAQLAAGLTLEFGRDGATAAPAATPAITLRCMILPAGDHLIARDLTPVPPQIKPQGLDIRAVASAGQMRITWIFDPAAYRRADLEQTAERLCAGLEQLAADLAGAETPAYTPSDFPMAQLDPQKLNNLLSSINRSQRRSHRE
nr:hypothetical protein [Herpetosiphonaceae bacterium]